jgi:diaminopimelate epimerase
MQLPFYKYHGTGNDFILIDHRANQYEGLFTMEKVAQMCHRRFGIGADGLILLEHSDIADFKMIYFNSDGRQSTMCGNGGRCIVHFAHFLAIFKEQTTFEAVDGLHYASITANGLISLGMNDVNTIQKEGNNTYILDTGSPHYVKISNNMPESIFTAGRKIRFAEPFKGVGINVNFVVRKEDAIDVCTYERGVEDETYSCGTGVVASALASIVDKNSGTYTITISTKGGQLQVSTDKADHHTYQNIRLIGPAIKVFEGSIDF